MVHYGFNRLALRSNKNPFAFEGKLKKMRIISNSICFGPCPEPEDEVEQHLTLNNKGRVWFSSYAYGGGFGRFKKIRAINFSIDQSAATELLEKVAACFGPGYEMQFVTDIGVWDMELTDTNGVIKKFHGSLCANYKVDGTDLSDLIRDTLNLPELYVFDGNDKSVE
jgi:hypothetical protein